MSSQRKRKHSSGLKPVSTRTVASDPSGFPVAAMRSDAKEAILFRWYRDQIKEAVPNLIAKWEPILGVTVRRVFVQQMKTKWGSCNPSKRSIRFNTDLAKKPLECLEYIVVHEMAHLLERTHNDRFVALMDRLMPQWRDYREQLNRLPVRHEKWVY